MSDRDAARKLLRELLPELLEEALGRGDGRANGNGAQPHGMNGSAPPAGAHAPPVPSPPVAAVLRPSTWDRPPAPGEVVGDAAPAPADAMPAKPVTPAAELPAPPAKPAATPLAAGTEWVTLDSDADLDGFVRALVKRFENPRDRMAIRAGTLRFALRRAAAGAAPGGAVLRVEQGAVTERTVAEAAAGGARLVLAPRAVLTPLAREKARALGVEIEQERRC
jgi:hypothetical protein